MSEGSKADQKGIVFGVKLSAESPMAEKENALASKRADCLAEMVL
jgi:hypothetical protein